MPQLKILTWNIWMMPSWAHQSPKNEARARAIGQELAKLDFDIIVFIKAFDAAARGVLRDELGARFPHRYGPLSFNGSVFKINGGVYVFSRVPLTVVKEIQWRDSKGAESMSRKGAMLLRGETQGRKFQLIGLHMQGESAPGDHNQGIRNKQIAQLASELVTTTSDPNVPLFICGDFNTQRRSHTDPFAESAAYSAMLERLGATNRPDFGETLDDRRVHNDLATDDTGRLAELDYILVRNAGQAITGKWHVLKLRRQGWDGPSGRRDLAYRYAVCCELTLP
jgi:endonuclease/exonuclease/phosphatase family metal-dependent hydrolase